MEVLKEIIDTEVKNGILNLQETNEMNKSFSIELKQNFEHVRLFSYSFRNFFFDKCKYFKNQIHQKVTFIFYY